jgi:hypothetical protein
VSGVGADSERDNAPRFLVPQQSRSPWGRDPGIGDDDEALLIVTSIGAESQP